MSLTVHNNIFSDNVINYILKLDQVVEAKKAVSNKAGVKYFSVQLPSSIKDTIYEKIGLDLRNVTDVNMRWIRGDTPNHIDNSVNHTSFENSYLIYLTDSVGKFISGDNSYPIVKNTAFVFNEGVNHETIETGDEPRLLLGPVNEMGMVVGVISSLNVPTIFEQSLEHDKSSAKNVVDNILLFNISLDPDVRLSNTQALVKAFNHKF